MPQQALNIKIAQEIIDEFNLTDDDIHRFNGGILVRDVVYKDVRKRVRRFNLDAATRENFLASADLPAR